MELKVLDVVKGCNTPAQGTALFEKIIDLLQMHDSIVISFSDVTEVTSSFINSSIVRLVLNEDLESVRSQIAISDVSKVSADMIRRCIRNAQLRQDLKDVEADS